MLYVIKSQLYVCFLQQWMNSLVLLRQHLWKFKKKKKFILFSTSDQVTAIYYYCIILGDVILYLIYWSSESKNKCYWIITEVTLAVWVFEGWGKYGNGTDRMASRKERRQMYTVFFELCKHSRLVKNSLSHFDVGPTPLVSSDHYNSL